MILGIPIDLLIKDNLVSLYDEDANTISYYFSSSQESILDPINMVS
jgi:hypothetical protein